MDYKVLTALKVIQEECKKHNNCDTCPLLGKNGDCGLKQDYPENWPLVARTVYF